MKAKNFAVLAVAGAFLAVSIVGAERWAPPVGGARASTPTAGTVSRGLPDFASVVQESGPAVVNIQVSGTRKASMQGPEGLPFRFGPPSDMPVQGQGSGFIVSRDGLVLTNAHVVAGASEVRVKLTDRREFQAKVLGVDPATDVAVLRIDAKDLPVVKLGNPASARVGDWVLAIGSPFGFENSVSAGIVSAKGRSLPGDYFVPFLQTDVAVNPGNSGGPLFNLAGEVIGINSQIYSRSGGYQGLSFAIPIDVALRIKDQIVATGKAVHARLGVAVQPVNQALADSFGLPKNEGALIASVQPGSAAARAGLEPGDIVLQYDGRPIVDSTDLPALVSQVLPGTRSSLRVWRKGRILDLTVTLGEAKFARAE